MPPRKKLTEDEIKKNQNLRGHMSAKDIQKKYEIGAPRLYKIWKSADHKQEDQSNEQLSRIQNMLQNIQSDKTDLNPQDSAIENNDSLSDNHLLLAMYRRVEDINQRLQHVQEMLEQAQDEVESVASDVENIDEKIEDVEINKNTITGIFQDMYKNIKTAEQLVFYGSITAGCVGIIACTLKYVYT